MIKEKKVTVRIDRVKPAYLLQESDDNNITDSDHLARASKKGDSNLPKHIIRSGHHVHFPKGLVTFI